MAFNNMLCDGLPVLVEKSKHFNAMTAKNAQSKNSKRIVKQCAIDVCACRSVCVSLRYPLQMQRETQSNRLQKKLSSPSCWEESVYERRSCNSSCDSLIHWVESAGTKAMGGTDTSLNVSLLKE